MGRRQGKEELTLNGRDGMCTIVFSPDGKRIVPGSLDGTVRVWDAQTGKAQRTFHLQTLKGEPTEVKSVAFSPDGKRIASGSRDDLIRLWDTDSWNIVRTIEARHGMVSSVVFSPDGERLASGGLDGQLRIWDLKTGGLKLYVTENPHKGWVSCEPTVHRGARKVFLPPLHDPRECLREPTAAEWLDVGQSFSSL